MVLHNGLCKVHNFWNNSWIMDIMNKLWTLWSAHTTDAVVTRFEELWRCRQWGHGHRRRFWDQQRAELSCQLPWWQEKNSWRVPVWSMSSQGWSHTATYWLLDKALKRWANMTLKWTSVCVSGTIGSEMGSLPLIRQICSAKQMIISMYKYMPVYTSYTSEMLYFKNIY